MPYFDLDMSVAKPRDIWGCFLFPNDKELATLFAVRHLVKMCGALDEICGNSANNANAAKPINNEQWNVFRAELERYGGLATLARLVTNASYHKEEQRAFEEGMLVGLALIKAIQIDPDKYKVSRKAAFKLVENHINKVEPPNGFIYAEGIKIRIKRSEKRLFECWNRRSCVAHWWAAILIWDSFVSDHQTDDPFDSSLLFLKNYPILAAISNAFLGAGASVEISNQSGARQPFISIDEALQLPEGSPPACISFDLSLLNDMEISLLTPIK